MHNNDLLQTCLSVKYTYKEANIGIHTNPYIANYIVDNFKKVIIN